MNTLNLRRESLPVVLALIAFLFKIVLAANTYGTNDIMTFESMAEKFQSQGPSVLYEEGAEAIYKGQLLAISQMNHPPFVLRLLAFWEGCHQRLGGSFGFWLRSTCACADLFAFWLIWRMFRDSAEHFWGLIVTAVAPGAIMISGFHGNTDPIMISFAVAAAYVIDRRLPVWLAGAAFGIACSIKVWPLVLMPVFFLSAGTWRRRAQFLIPFAITVCLLASPWIFTIRELIVSRVFDYSPFEGWWGFSYAFPGHGQALQTAVFVMVVSAAAYMHERVPSVFVQCGILSFLFMFFTPGFGPQYLAWVMPWTITAGWRAASFFHLAAGTFLFRMYTAWCAHFPWYFANAFVNPIPRGVFRIGLAAWILLLVLIYRAYRENARRLVPVD